MGRSDLVGQAVEVGEVAGLDVGGADAEAGLFGVDAVEIDQPFEQRLERRDVVEGECYWDGGIVSNTPLQWVLESEPRQDTLAFQVDLWSARGELPRDMIEVDTRQKDIRYSSRTRAGTTTFRKMQALRRAAAKLLEQMRPELRQTPEAELLAQAADTKVYNIIHLIYHARNYEGASKDYEFSRRTMEEHWKTGYSDMEHTLRHPEVLQRPQSPDGVFIFDLKDQGREQEKLEK